MLTAAHCIGLIDDTATARVRGPGEFYVYAPPDRNLADAPQQSGGGSFEILRIDCLDTYQGLQPDPDDLAIITLARIPLSAWPYKNASGKTHIHFPPSPDADLATWPQGREGTVAGWGRTTESSGVSSRLMQVQLARQRGADCPAGDKMLCLGGDRLGRDSCGGDSGGFAGIVEPDGRMLQVGIVSHGPAACGEAGKPASYTRISRHLDFIRGFVPDAGKP